MTLACNSNHCSVLFAKWWCFISISPFAFISWNPTLRKSFLFSPIYLMTLYLYVHIWVWTSGSLFYSMCSIIISGLTTGDSFMLVPIGLMLSWGYFLMEVCVWEATFCKGCCATITTWKECFPNSVSCWVLLLLILFLLCFSSEGPGCTAFQGRKETLFSSMCSRVTGPQAALPISLSHTSSVCFQEVIQLLNFYLMQRL